MLRNLSIKIRLIGVIAFLSIQLIIGGVIGIVSLGHANEAMHSLYDDRLVSLGQLDRIVRLLQNNEALIAKALTGEQAAAQKTAGEVNDNIAAIDKALTAYAATYLTAEEKKLVDEFADARKKYLADGLKPALAALQSLDMQGATAAVHGPMTALFQPVRDKVDALIKLQLDVSKHEYERSQSTYLLVRNTCIVALLFGIALAALVGWWLVQAITKPLDEAVALASDVAEGDLTRKIDVRANDETGRLMLALKNMSDSLVQIVSQVRAGTETIATASTQIAAGNHDLSARTEQQAGSLEETASSLEELTSTVRQNADNARQANQLAGSASEVASRGGAVVSQVVETMASINESSKQIADIIGVIDGIAFQTNILALNAAVEAARAGEQGRGFAVVAAEVRNLAQRSSSAAKEIRDLIGASVEKVGTGTKLVDQAGSTMQEIVDSIKRVTDLMGEIAAASQEQSAGIEQINRAVEQMEQVTQQNASLVEQAAAASESMRDQATSLSLAVSVFKLAENGAAAASPAIARKAVRAAPAVPATVARARPANRPAPKKPAASAPAPRNADEWEEF